jgi:UDP-N-acetylmuramyl tripeptide synthase
VVYPRPAFTDEEKSAQEAALQGTDYAQPAIGALSAGLFRLLGKAGFKADFAAGHSFGEVSALWAAGVLSDEDYYALVKARGAAMSLAAGGHSQFNVSNLAAAALAATGLGIAPSAIAAVFGRFGQDPADNPGRLMRYEVGGLNLIVDFAHNPEALAGLVEFAERLRRHGRLALLLGQAGNREDADIDRLAAAAAAAKPDLIVVKELGSYLRGREAGEVPALLKRALARAGVGDAALADAPDEAAAVRLALGWARTGDVIVLPLHTREGRASGLALIDALRRAGWSAGQPLPA